MIGDTPYGAAQIVDFPNLRRRHQRRRPASPSVVHVGDIKNGSTRCDTTYFQHLRLLRDASTIPLIYTPGDNEWTDCHRANNGAYDPLERLAVLRVDVLPGARAWRSAADASRR